MLSVHKEPNWSLVTKQFQEPETFTDLLALLIPEQPYGSGAERAILEWRETQFYKLENLQHFLYYAMHTIRVLPRFHRDEMAAIMRMIRLCQEAGWYEQAYTLLEQEGFSLFVRTALSVEEWDVWKEIAAWNYLIVRWKTGRLTEEDHAVWERVKFCESWALKHAELVSQREMLAFTLFYMCDHIKRMPRQEAERDMMRLAEFCNTYIAEIYTYGFFVDYEAFVKYAAHYQIHEAVLASQRAVLAQVCDLFGYDAGHSYDFISEMGDVMTAADFHFLQQHREFVGKLLSYIMFLEAVRVPSHVLCFESLLAGCKGLRFKEELLRQYVFPYLHESFISFCRYFLRSKRYESIHHILFYWCTDEQRLRLEGMYNLSAVYEKYVCG
ncbi:DUF3965 domain-containing protein [Ectobacillus ponti]|uniref:DUF3965 domain-containing protein n=1 Tax=Ectobacillus ponti TaxID=2961894 RepID=A0AA42BNM0_9BACI|nr:DUF3965 domain-containing protein [Ectobacillus ponti]MCP8968125.1 DUF3965 domain-containing protein [Ectobacillus ponti]